MITCLSLTLHKKLQNLPKNVSITRMDEKKIYNREFQLKGIGGNVRGKLLQKWSTGKTTKCSKHLRHIAIEKMFFQNLTKLRYRKNTMKTRYVKNVHQDDVQVYVGNDKEVIEAPEKAMERTSQESATFQMLS